VGEFDWRLWVYKYVTSFLLKCELGFYAAFCVGLYTFVFREALPGKLAEVFLLVVLLRGVPSGQPWGKAAALIRGLLEAIIKNLPDTSA
jgi:hypothetical protein